MVDSLLEHIGQRDRRTLARLLTQAARGELPDDSLAALPAKSARAQTIAVTGSPGVGKSTLVGRLVEALRQRGQRVAVLACDPQSPRTGGALLGDRCRMPAGIDDDVFIRSLATPSGSGAIAPHLGTMIRLLHAFGFDQVILETVGAGQGDTAVRELADTVVLLVQPESGDELQWEKAGILEVADIIVVHKADLPGAEQTAAHAKTAVELLGSSTVPVIPVSSKTAAGLDALLDSLPAQLDT